MLKIVKKSRNNRFITILADVKNLWRERLEGDYHNYFFIAIFHLPLFCTFFYSESSSDDDSIYDDEANRNFHRGARSRDSGASSSSSFSDVSASPRHSERPRSAAYVKYQIPGNTSRQALADVMQSARHCEFYLYLKWI